MTGWTLEPSYPPSRTPKFQCLLREDGETPESVSYTHLVGKVVIAYIRKRENGVGVIFLYSYGLPAHLFLHRLGADFLGDGVGIIFCPVSLYLFRKVGQTDFGIVILTLIGAVHGNELKGVVGDMTAHGIINVAVGAACTLGFYFEMCIRDRIYWEL